MAQIPSRLCTLPELLPFPSHEICASDLSLQPRRSSPRNSTLVFSSAMQSLTNRPMQIIASDTFSLALGKPLCWRIFAAVKTHGRALAVVISVAVVGWLECVRLRK